MRRAREEWASLAVTLLASCLVFVDESSAKTNMTRLYGWAPEGGRASGDAPHGHWMTHTMISSMRLDGTTASMTVDSATDGDVFETYARTTLAPTPRPGDIVILDNLAAHKRAKVAEIVHARGARIMFLPPYSPDLNPIEKMWSKIKSILRSLEPRTIEELHAAITYAFSKVTPEDTRSFFESCGYVFI